MKSNGCTRRDFLHRGLVFAAGAPLALTGVNRLFGAAGATPSSRADAKVAIVACRGYGAEVGPALNQSFDLLGGIRTLVKDKTVTVKLNLTGTNFDNFLGHSVGETFMTHYDTALALAAALFKNGAKRVRFVESTQSKSSLEGTLALADWDIKALEALGKIEFENTRNLGKGKSYSHFSVPDGRMFSSFDMNQSYEETDVMVSLSKLKNHITAGVTLSMKNLFGITPNSLYGDEAGNEEATAGRGPLHNPGGFINPGGPERVKLPGLKAGTHPTEPTSRVPRIVVDICAARPIHLAIIDGITSMKGGEGPWCGGEEKLKYTTPGVLIVGLNPVSTDAVGTAVMGYENPLAARGIKPFDVCDNHILMAHQAGLGTGDLNQIDVRGMPIAKARYPYG